MTAPPAESEEIFDYAEAQGKIIHEHTLINHRMTWMMLSQAFLLASYFGLQKRALSCGDPLSRSHLPVLLYLAIFCGISLCFVFIGSFFAAFLAIRRWKHMCKDRNEITALTSRMGVHFLGDAPPVVISFALLSFWAIIAHTDLDLWWRDITNSELVAPWACLILGLVLWFLMVREIFSIRTPT